MSSINKRWARPGLSVDRCGLWLALGLILTAGSAFARPQLTTLPNGLRLVVEADHSAPVAAVYFFVGTGSSLEDNYLGTGLSHFIEHTINEGTTTRSRQQIERTRVELGNNANAFTSKQIVAYHMVTAGSQVLTAIDDIADYVFNPTFPEAEVETQRGIILREMARGEDDTGRRLYNLFAATMFRVSPDRVPIIGYREAFQALTRDDLVAYHTRAYVPENVVVAVVGDFDPDAVTGHLRELLEPLPSRAYHAPPVASEPPQLAPRRTVQTDPRLSRAYLMMGYPTVSLYSPDMYPLDLAAYILAHGDSSRLVARLRDELGLVDGVGASSHTPSYDAGFFAISAVLDPDNLAAAEEAISAELKRLIDEPVTEAELQRACRQKLASLVASRQTAEDRAQSYGSDVLLTGDLQFGQRYLEGLQRVTADDIQAAARRYLRAESYNFVALTPTAEPMTTAAATAPAVPAEIHEIRLANGLRLLVQENHAVPLVNLFAACPGGLRYENDETAGLTNLMAQMMVRGTKSRDRLQIATALDEVGGTLSPYSGRNSFGLAGQVMTEHLPLLVELAAEALRYPTFPASELDSQKLLTLAALNARQDNVDSQTSDLMLQNLFTRHPYRYPPAGTEASVAALTRDDLVSFHQRYCRPNGLVIALFGDVTPQQAQALVEQWLGDFEPDEISPPPAPAEPPLTAPRERTLTQPQQQAVICYGFRGPIIDSPDRYARDVMTAAFAGIGYPGGRLHQALRDAQLVYATWAYAVPGPENGWFTIYAGTAADKVEVVRETIEGLIRDLQDQPLSDDELTLARQVAISAHAVSLAGSAARAQAVALDVMYGLGADETFRYAGQVQQITAEQVQQQARTLLDLQHRVVVVTTPGE
jgi:zinc protease